MRPRRRTFHPCLVVLATAFALSVWCAAQDEALVPALIIFGDSSSDVGNNNYRLTLFKANYPPYGRDFRDHEPTGRFCNGKLVVDFTAEALGFNTYPAAYISPQATGDRLLSGANFASAGSGYDDHTSFMNHAIPLSQQLEYFLEYKDKINGLVGDKNSSSIISDSIYVLSTGSTDFAQNYYVNPFLYKRFTPEQYGSYLIGQFTSFVQKWYDAGGRKLGVSTLPPLGCVPLVRNLLGFGIEGCVLKINVDAKNFNRMLNATVNSLQKQLPDAKIALFDAYRPVLDLLNQPEENGIFETARGCCGTGTLETTKFLCNSYSRGTCSNASHYVFWDSAHPTEAANKYIADSLLIEGLSLI